MMMGGGSAEVMRRQDFRWSDGANIASVRRTVQTTRGSALARQRTDPVRRLERHLVPTCSEVAPPDSGWLFLNAGTAFNVFCGSLPLFYPNFCSNGPCLQQFRRPRWKVGTP